MFALLNSLPDEENDIKKIIEAEIEEDYRKSKLKDSKIILGKGSFGKVRLAVSLLENLSMPGELICVKKSKTFAELGNNKIKDAIDQNDQIVTGIVEDYFTSEFSDLIFSAQSLDLSIVSN